MYYRYQGLEILKEIETPYEFLKDLDILLIRHGESESNALRKRLKQEGKLLTEEQQIEDAVIPLSPEGEKQAIELGKRLEQYRNESQIKKEEILVLISPYERARKTFELANTSLKLNEKEDSIFVLNNLREQSYGAFHMISREVKKELYEKIYLECQKNSISYYKPQFLGESPADVSNRLWSVIEFIKEYTKKRPIKSVLVFGHGNINRCMLMNLLNLPPEFYDDFQMGSNSSMIHIKHGKYNEFNG